MGARLQPNSPTDHPRTSAGRCSTAGPTRSATWCSAPTRSRATRSRSRRSRRRCQDLRETFGVADAAAALRARAHRRAGGARGSGAGQHGDLVPEPRPAATTRTRPSGSRSSRCSRTRRQRAGEYGMYFETGQGSELTNGHGDGVDMVVHEARKYGFARLLTAAVAGRSGRRGGGGAVGARQRRRRLHRPEVFRSREQLVRCCLEDIAMGKLHGLAIGLDICARCTWRSTSTTSTGASTRSCRPTRLPDGAADQERPDARLPDDLVSGPRPRARARSAARSTTRCGRSSSERSR
jgi:ethanolamine ammonia-lyase large subunit